MTPCSCSGNMDKIQVTQKVSGLSVNILVYIKSFRLKNFQVEGILDSIQGTNSRLKETQKISKDLEKFADSLESNMTPRYREESK